MENHHFLKKGFFLYTLWRYGRHPSSKSHGFRDFGEGPGMRILTGAGFANSIGFAGRGRDALGVRAA
jgi:hypothetical protein